MTHLLDQFGFDTVDAGPLREGWRIQRDPRLRSRAERQRNSAGTWRRPSGMRISNIITTNA